MLFIFHVAEPRLPAVNPYGLSGIGSASSGSSFLSPRASRVSNFNHAGEHALQPSSVFPADPSNVIYPTSIDRGCVGASGSLYNSSSLDSFVTDGWFCDLCSIALPTAVALNQVIKNLVSFMKNNYVQGCTIKSDMAFLFQIQR